MDNTNLYLIGAGHAVCEHLEFGSFRVDISEHTQLAPK